MTTNRGFIKWIIIIVIALLVLSYYGFSLRTLVDSPVTQDNIHYVATSTVSVWDKYLKNPATYLYKDIFINLIWEPAIDNLTKIKNSEPTNVQTSSPKLPNPVPIPN
ncbi:MAG: hypothetical protein PHG25_00370 [Candidatus Pacebacteria bacterium]|nr:hypothetical protein [Candidatus Paceibacterota bacterium]